MWKEYMVMPSKHVHLVKEFFTKIKGHETEWSVRDAARHLGIPSGTFRDVCSRDLKFAPADVLTGGNPSLRRRKHPHWSEIEWGYLTNAEIAEEYNMPKHVVRYLRAKHDQCVTLNDILGVKEPTIRSMMNAMNFHDWVVLEKRRKTFTSLDYKEFTKSTKRYATIPRAWKLNKWVRRYLTTTGAERRVGKADVYGWTPRFYEMASALGGDLERLEDLE